MVENSSSVQESTQHSRPTACRSGLQQVFLVEKTILHSNGRVCKFPTEVPLYWCAVRQGLKTTSALHTILHKKNVGHSEFSFISENHFIQSEPPSIATLQALHAKMHKYDSACRIVAPQRPAICFRDWYSYTNSLEKCRGCKECHEPTNIRRPANSKAGRTPTCSATTIHAVCGISNTHTESDDATISAAGGTNCTTTTQPWSSADTGRKRSLPA